ncbi:type VII secretion protein EccE [Mycobacterium asiaticum]|uniref:type VII secretion protein EccE n=1 Tax=Mycobacterium asiaticum TaxID=1790 RepID=UPI00056AEDE0|nr:type VII secretion protein EccE [Mycobacterium asiaticum]ORA12342.1 type VII secretion protein EccE [Mycobacterium asiaticum DSM 44297]
MTFTTNLVTTAAIFVVTITGLAGFGYAGATAALVIGLAVGVIPWRRRTAWSWMMLWFRRNRPIRWTQPRTVANDRAGGGVRFQDGVAAAAVQLLGRAHAPTFLTGSASVDTENVLNITELTPLLEHSLGLKLDSLSVISTGARRRSSGDYPRVYDTLIGTPPYAGQRETWLILRISLLDNIEALRWRGSAGTATLAAAQRISAAMRQQGIRARVATAADIVELEHRLGRPALDTQNRRWTAVRGTDGWLTTYGYRPQDLSTQSLAHAWTIRSDGITQNITLFGDGSVTATLTVRSAQPPTAPPSMLLQTLPGEQAQAVAANLCGPRPLLPRIRHGRLTEPLVVPVGPSGVLLGKVRGGRRMLLPLDDPGEFSRVHISADDALSKRIMVRMVGAGERITVHTRNPKRWDSIRMPDVTITDHAKPVAGTTVSVVDGTVTPAPRPNTVVSVHDSLAPYSGAAEVLITQRGPATVDVTVHGQTYTVEVELFRAENRYVSSEPTSLRSADLASVESS